MKKIILLTISLYLFNAALFAQSNDIIAKDSLLKSFKQLYGKKPGSINNNLDYRYLNDAIRPINPLSPVDISKSIYMPNAFTQKLQLTWLENKGNGFSIYQSTPDNMYILKPDSTFYSAMPVK